MKTSEPCDGPFGCVFMPTATNAAKGRHGELWSALRYQCVQGRENNVSKGITAKQFQLGNPLLYIAHSLKSDPIIECKKGHVCTTAGTRICKFPTLPQALSEQGWIQKTKGARCTYLCMSYPFTSAVIRSDAIGQTLVESQCSLMLVFHPYIWAIESSLPTT